VVFSKYVPFLKVPWENSRGFHFCIRKKRKEIPLLNLFILYLEEQGCSKNTIRSYAYILKVFRNQDIKDIKLKDLELLLSDNLKTAAVQQAAFKKYFGWLYKQGHITLNPAEGLLVPRAEYSREPITPEDKEAIMNAIYNLPLMPRAFFLMLEKTEMTPAELLELNTDSPLPDISCINKLCPREIKGPLFTTARNRRATYDWAYYWWSKVLKHSGVKYNMYQLKYPCLKTG
jgi:hypothetical protein